MVSLSIKTYHKHKIEESNVKFNKKYNEKSKKYIKLNLFENSCMIKSEKC